MLRLSAARCRELSARTTHQIPGPASFPSVPGLPRELPGPGPAPRDRRPELRPRNSRPRPAGRWLHFTRCLLSSAGQSTALVKRGSSVRTRQGAQREGPVRRLEPLELALRRDHGRATHMPDSTAIPHPRRSNFGGDWTTATKKAGDTPGALPGPAVRHARTCAVVIESRGRRPKPCLSASEVGQRRQEPRDATPGDRSRVPRSVSSEACRRRRSAWPCISQEPSRGSVAGFSAWLNSRRGTLAADSARARGQPSPTAPHIL